MTDRAEINPKNLKRIAWLNGHSVSSVAKKIRRARQSVYASVHLPSRFPITFELLNAALPIREANNDLKAPKQN